MSQFKSLLGITEVIADSAEISNIDLTTTVITGLTTTNVAEGKNLYFTDTRVNNNSNVSSNTTHRGLTNNPHSVSASQVGINSTDDITEGLTNLYYTDDQFDTRFELKTTTELKEGTNLYYTDARFDAGFDARLAIKSADNLSEGLTNLYYTTARSNTDFDTRLSTKKTTDLKEGTNLYYTDTRVTNNSYVSSNTAHRGLTNNPHSVTASQVGINNTDDVKEGLTNLYYTTARSNTDFDTRLSTKKTTDLKEGTNLYYTDTRVNNNSNVSSNTAHRGLTNNPHSVTASQVGINNTDDVKEGLTNLYYTTARSNTDFDAKLATKSTDNLSEGLTNLYYTDTRVNNNSNVSANTTHRGLTNNPHSVSAAQVGINSTDDVKEGLTNLYYTEARVSANTNVAANTAFRNVGHLPLTGGTMTGDIIFDIPTTFNMPYSSPAEYAPTASTGTGAYAPSQAFNGNTSDSSCYSNTGVYDPNDDYAYIGTVETSIDGKLTGGEWIQIQSTAAKLRITSIDLRAPFNNPAYAPEDFILCVSDDNVEFTSILSITGAALGNNATVYTPLLSGMAIKNAYYFRIVVTRTNNAPRTGLARWFITFTQGPSLNVSGSIINGVSLINDVNFDDLVSTVNTFDTLKLSKSGGTMTGDIIFTPPTTFNMPYSSPAEYAPTASTGSGGFAPSQAFNGNTTDSAWYSNTGVYDSGNGPLRGTYIGTVETSIDGKLTGSERIQIQSTAARLRITSIDLGPHLMLRHMPRKILYYV